MERLAERAVFYWRFAAAAAVDAAAPRRTAGGAAPMAKVRAGAGVDLLHLRGGADRRRRQPLFPVPALIWCAISYPLWLTSALTLLTGITEIILVVHNVMNIQGADSLLPPSHLTSARLGVATVAISPLIVAVSMDAIRQLNRQLALRANHDFLTGLLTRSGLYARLEQMKETGAARSSDGRAVNRHRLF